MVSIFCTRAINVLDNTSFLDWGQLFLSFLTFLIAWIALSTWKKELLGKKQINLAMDIVEKVCNIEDCLSAIRNPLTTATESDEIETNIKKEFNQDEQPQVHKNKLYYLAPAYRITKNWNKIQDFLALRNQARLYWEDDIVELFDRISHLIANVRNASMMLYNYNDLKPDLIKEFEYKIWDHYSKEDAIKKEMHNIVEEFIMNLEPLYMQQKSSWKKLTGTEND
ncbi:MAG: hypothetical protein ACLSWJ_05365 [Alphaproteobacteria bacterium]